MLLLVTLSTLIIVQILSKFEEPIGFDCLNSAKRKLQRKTSLSLETREYYCNGVQPIFEIKFLNLVECGTKMN